MWVERELAWTVPLFVGLSGLACAVAAQACTHRKLRARRRLADPRALQPISVLKPLKGLDEGLYENLASIARQDYPQLEIIIGVDDPLDPACAVAQRVRRDFPHVPMRIVARPSHGALNPKVGNLLNMVEHASHDCLLISDSNVRVSSDYLRVIASELSGSGVGLVSNVIVGMGERSLGALLENVQLCTFVIAGVCFGDASGHPIVVGKSMLLRRSQLEALGGLRAMADVLAEDYVLGQRYHEAGIGVVLSAHPVLTHNRSWSLSRFIARHLRWAQLRRWSSLSTFVAELLMYPVPWLAAAMALALSSDAGGAGASRAQGAMLYAAAGVAIKVLADFALVWDVRKARPPLRALALLAVRDFLLVAIWCTALARRSVVWRGHRRRLLPGTRLLPASADAASAAPAEHTGRAAA